MKITDILKAYTNGEKTIAETNTILAEIKSDLRLAEDKNSLTNDEIAMGTAGLLDSGTGSINKVFIDTEKMELVNCDMGKAVAFCIVKGKTYRVDGKKLVE